MSLPTDLELFGDQNPFGDPSWYQGFHSPYYKESHRKLRALIRELVETDLIPNVHDWDESKDIPVEFRKKAYATGMAVLACGYPFPVEYGPNLPEFLIGEKLDIFHAIIVMQEVCRGGSIGVGWGLGGGLCIGLPPVLTFGSDAMKKKVAPSVLRGDRVICLAVTEPTCGSDVSRIESTAVKSACGKFYVVNGVKKWITNGCFSDYMTVLVRTGGEGMKGLSLLLIETNSPGVKTARMKCSGVWCSGTTLITLENVRVPVENLIGKENKGFKYVVHNFNCERVNICAQAVASARVCLEEAWKHALRRKTFGKRLFDHQVIRVKLGEMARQIEACQAWLENIAFQIQTMHPREADMKISGPAALLKVQCTKVLELCAREAAQIFGGLSFTRGGLGEKVERLGREVRSLAIPGGSEEIMIDLGVRMTNKIALLGHQMLTPESMADPVIGKQIALAKRAGVNVDIFGDGVPFGDPSWYMTYNTPYYNSSHKRLRAQMRTEVDKFAKSTNNSDLGRLVESVGVTEIAAGVRCAVAGLSGVQVDRFHALIAVDELARLGSIGLVSRLWVSPATIAVLQKMGAGQVIGSAGVVAVAVGEKDVYNNDWEQIQTKATLIGGKWRISGQKIFVETATVATSMVVLAKAEGEGGLSMFVVSRSASGVSVTPSRVCSGGDKFDATGDVNFANAEATLVGKVGQGKALLDMIEEEKQWAMSVLSTRFARICYEEALTHSQTKEFEGRPIVQLQGVRFKLGEMARQIEAASAWLEELTYQWTCSGSSGSRIGLLKLHTAKMFDFCAREACQILGSLACVTGSSVNHFASEAKTIALMSGSEDMLLDESVSRVQALCIDVRKAIKNRQAKDASKL